MNVIEELFKKSEDGKLSYEDFVKFSNGMKFADISKGEYVSKQKFDDKVSELTGQLDSLNETLGKRDADLADLQKQLTEAGNDATKLAELNTNLTDLQAKYDADVKEYQAKLAQKSYEYAVNNIANSKKFTSGAAKRDFIHSLIDSNLTMEGDNIVGVDDFITKYATDNADAFVVEASDPTPDSKLPQFAGSTQGQSDSNNSDKNPFGWNFAGVR